MAFTLGQIPKERIGSEGFAPGPGAGCQRDGAVWERSCRCLWAGTQLAAQGKAGFVVLCPMPPPRSSLLPSPGVVPTRSPAKPNDLTETSDMFLPPFPPPGVSFLLFQWVKSAHESLQQRPELVQGTHR